MKAVTIWHNPRCGKSRQTLALLRAKGIEPAVREYLKQPPSKAEIEKLMGLLDGDTTELIRDGEPQFKKLGKKKSELGKADIAAAIARHPILLQRPVVVVAGERAAIGRPPEAVLPLLK